MSNADAVEFVGFLFVAYGAGYLSGLLFYAFRRVSEFF